MVISDVRFASTEKNDKKDGKIGKKKETETLTSGICWVFCSGKIIFLWKSRRRCLPTLERYRVTRRGVTHIITWLK